MIIPLMPEENVYPVTRNRLRKMCNYFKNKKVHVSYEYNNSIEHHSIRKYNGIFDSFTIDTINCTGHNIFDIKLYLNDDVVFTEQIGEYGEFYGLGKVRESTSGPYCFLTFHFK